MANAVKTAPKTTSADFGKTHGKRNAEREAATEIKPVASAPEEDSAETGETEEAPTVSAERFQEGDLDTQSPAADLVRVYEELGSQIGFVEEQQEITVAFVAGALALLLAGGALSMLWFRRLP